MSADDCRIKLFNEIGDVVRSAQIMLFNVPVIVHAGDLNIISVAQVEAAAPDNLQHVRTTDAVVEYYAPGDFKVVAGLRDVTAGNVRGVVTCG